ncbi:MerR family transcriptional regulator [Collinsella sp. An2]|uniref:MerR family transcriptional regulator n=1 Tax=Collinsella sp. An2 TaxID=1965585 RepID=UPI000B3A3657|nr:MerR family transcriptional regulator [Collinsella sp. An2]OUP06642.1 MerR family transcriptional regulator [Collinsella sp. An2]
MRIAEVVERYGISADTLRYYERIGLLPHVARTASGIRDYSEADCSRISFIKCMRQANVPIEALTTYMRLLDQGDDTLAERKALLEEQRDLIQQRIDEMQAGLERLTFKIDHYDDLMVQAEQTIQG